MRKPLAALVFAMTVGTLVLVVDVVGPLFGYENWRYGEDEMRAAVEGTWELTIAEPDGTTTKTWKLEIRESGNAARAESDTGWIRSAAACGNRTFVRSAHACVTESSMPIEIAVLARPDTRVSGQFYVSGTTFTRGHLTMFIGNDEKRMYVGASLDPTGKVLEVSAEHPGANTRSEATLVRTSAASH